MSQSKPTVTDILITLAVGDRHRHRPRRAGPEPRSAWRTGHPRAPHHGTSPHHPGRRTRAIALVAEARTAAPIIETRTAAPVIEPEEPQPAPTLEWPLPARIIERALAADRLAEAPTVDQLQSALAAGDVGSLVAWVPDGHDTFEVVDLAEREPPRAAGPIAAAVLLDGLMAASPAPRVVGWFELPSRAPDGTVSDRYLGVITCCWQRQPDTPAAPAGWLLEVSDGDLAWSLWVWLGSAQEGATTGPAHGSLGRHRGLVAIPGAP